MNICIIIHYKPGPELQYIIMQKLNDTNKRLKWFHLESASENECETIHNETLKLLTSIQSSKKNQHPKLIIIALVCLI